MRAQVKRSEWVAKSRECGALWEKDDDGFLFFGFFQADGRRRTQKKRETKQKQKDNTTPKKKKTKQNKQTEISLVLYLSTHT